MNIKTLKEIKKDVISLKDDLKNHINEFKKSNLYDEGLQVSDALKDARDSFKRMYAEDYYKYMTFKTDLLIDTTVFYNRLIEIYTSSDYTKSESYDTNEQLFNIVFNELNKWNSFSKVNVYKKVIDPIDSKEKIFKVGQILGKKSSSTLCIIFSSEYLSRCFINHFIAKGYTYEKNNEHKLINRIKNSLK